MIAGRHGVHELLRLALQQCLHVVRRRLTDERHGEQRHADDNGCEYAAVEGPERKSMRCVFRHDQSFQSTRIWTGTVH